MCSEVGRGNCVQVFGVTTALSVVISVKGTEKNLTLAEKVRCICCDHDPRSAGEAFIVDSIVMGT